jgi:phage FluMu protein Com
MKSDPRRKDDEEVRCECGHLLAKLTAEGLEMKCRRCKRIHVLQISPTTLTSVRPQVKKTGRNNRRKQQG